MSQVEQGAQRLYAQLLSYGNGAKEDIAAMYAAVLARLLASGASIASNGVITLTQPPVFSAASLTDLPSADLSNLNASNLTSGTVPDARFPATLPAANGSALTALNASNLGSGTVPDARFPATLPAASGANLTALNASNLGSGTVPDARFPATLPAASGVNLTALNASNLGSGTIPDARFPATLPAVSGANLTNLDATDLTGTIDKARLPAGNVIQVVSATYSTQGSTSSTTYADTGLTASITPRSASSKILVLVTQAGVGKDSGNDCGLNLKLLRDSTDLIAFGQRMGRSGDTGGDIVSASASYLDSPATTSALTYKTQMASSSAGQTALAQYQSSVSTITLLEIQG